MSIKESALNAIAALTNSDFVRMVTSAGASRKATLQTIAQHIIENYAGSTLAGSQQSVKSALDALNSNSTFLYTNTSWTKPSIDETRIAYVSGGYAERGGVVYVNITLQNIPTYPFNAGAFSVVSGMPRPDGNLAPLTIGAMTGDSNVSKLVHAEVVNATLRITCSAALGAPSTASIIRIIGAYKKA